MDKRFKKNQKASRRKTFKKEFEIPIYIINKKEGNAAPASPELEGTDQEKFQSNELKIVEDENALPVLETVGSNAHGDSLLAKEKFSDIQSVRAEDSEESAGLKDDFFGGDRADKAVVKKTDRTRIKGKIFTPPEGKREKIMWVSVFLIAGLIFFIWLWVLKENFSFSFGPQNPFTTQGEDNNLNDLKNRWDTLRNQWSNFNNSLEQKAAASANQQLVDKLKERILVEELKNKMQTGEQDIKDVPH